MTHARLALSGLSCRYPDAASFEELWRNCMDGRLAFREMPVARLDLSGYGTDAAPADRIAPACFGLLHGWSFQREAFRQSLSTVEQTDLSHWLALDLAAETVSRVGLEHLNRDRTAVVVGNTLTGDASRTALLRMRAPYLQRLLEQAMRDTVPTDMQDQVKRAFIDALQRDLKAPTEDSLAGGLANTIAGRIANYFDFRGGAFAVDGACASSHIALAQASELVRSGTVEAVLVGAVDISLDPFELIGFSRNGALNDRRMRVFDRQSNGFWPGEGGAFALLTARSLAEGKGLEVDAWLTGCGLSTDGAGGLTRPSQQGQCLAIRRALSASGLGVDDISFVEAHGTGTAVGDPIEVRALNEVFAARSAPLPIGSVKASIGHTKAAAGFAGLAKIVGAFKTGWVPGHIGCEQENAVFLEKGCKTEPSVESVELGDDAAVGLSGFGFGGVNAHAILERPANARASEPVFSRRPVFQEHELFCLSAADTDGLKEKLRVLVNRARHASISEMTDMAAEAGAAFHGPARAAIVASRPAELLTRAETAFAIVDTGMTQATETPEVHVGLAATAPTIGILFPGQAAPVRTPENAWLPRFAELADLGRDLPGAASSATEIAQPAIIASALAGLKMFRSFGLEGTAAVGHSVGEIAALHWAGVLSEYQCRKLASLRGRLMAQHGGRNGAMLRVEGPTELVRNNALSQLLEIGCENAPDETVVSGPEKMIRKFAGEMEAADLACEILNVSHAFHSQLMMNAQFALRREVEMFAVSPVERQIISTVTGARLTDRDNVLDLLTDQVVVPVLFVPALTAASETCDIFVELGSGRGLSRLAQKCGQRAIPVDVFASDLRALLSALGQLFVMGANPNLGRLFSDRVTRPVAVPNASDFFSNPCGGAARAVRSQLSPTASPSPSAPAAAGSVIEQVRACIAAEMDLEVAHVGSDARLSEDLHLSSIAVGRVLADLRAVLNIGTILHATDLAAETVAGLARHLEELRDLGPEQDSAPARIEGAAFWARCFRRSWTPAAGHSLFENDAGTMAWEPLDTSARDIAAGLTAGDIPGALITCPYDIRFATAIELWEKVKDASGQGLRHLAIVHEGLQLEGFTASLLLDGAFDTIRLLDILSLETPPLALPKTLKSMTRAPQFSVRIEDDGRILRPGLTVSHIEPSPNALELDGDDLILVTGGAKGIGAECALRLATRTGARLLLIGRSSGRSAPVQSVLSRAKNMGISAAYVAVDISDYHRSTVKLAECELKLGKITAVIHAAGVNHPARFENLSTEDLDATFGSKLEGLESVLTLIDRKRMKFLASFGSIIAHTGLAGESHYALANAFLGMRLEEWHAEPAHKGTPPRYLGLDWSIWAGVGMGERLGAVERLQASGVDPIPLEDGLDLFEHLCADTQATGNFVVASRHRAEKQPWARAPSLPSHRFVDRLLAHTPGVELVSETMLSPGSDPYLLDHMLGGRPVMPGVMLLEALAQNAAALTGSIDGYEFRGVEFRAPIWCPPNIETKLQVAVLQEADGSVTGTIRSSNDAFARIAMRARLVAQATPAPVLDVAPDRDPIPAADFQDSLFFSSGRMRRLEAIDHLSAFAVGAGFSDAEPCEMFGAFQAQDLILGDASARDSGLQALLATVPQLEVLPESIGSIRILDAASTRRRVEARQVRADQMRFTFDILWRDAGGKIVEFWRNATFARVGERAAWPDHPALASVYLEREVQLRTGRSDLRLALTSRADSAARGEARLGLDPLGHRGDGKPLAPDSHVSRAHAGDWTLTATGKTAVAVDLVAPGDDPALSAPDTAPTLVARQALWAARETQRKKGGLARGAIAFTAAERVGSASLGEDLFVYIHDGSAGLLGVLVSEGPANVARATIEDGRI